MWRFFNVSMADGRAHDLRTIKSKSEYAQGADLMPALGNSLNLVYPGRRLISEAKRLKYLSEGRHILEPVSYTHLTLPTICSV